MDWLWLADDMVRAMEGRPVGSLPKGVSGLSIDSRSVGSGEAFFAIRGDRFDGHDFTSAAIANGASLLVVSEEKLPALGAVGVPMIVVDDVLAALGRLGVAARARSDAKIVAITGSVGKTTTKAMLAHALATGGAVHSAVASFNNHWGVPLTLARMPAKAEFGVFEIGMNHPGEIRPLVKMVRPHVAIVTTIAAAHLGYFSDLDEIAAAKAEIFEGIEPGGAAILNRDNEKYDLLRSAAAGCGVERIFSFGADPAADFRLLGVELKPDRSDMRVSLLGEVLELTVGAPGRHIVDNALAVLGAVRLVGCDPGKAATALAALPMQKGRGERHRLRVGDGTVELIDESYNANPASMRAALALLAQASPVGDGRRIAVLGDMLELGRFSEQLHAGLCEPVDSADVDGLYLAGAEMAALAGAVSSRVAVKSFDDAVPLADELVRDLRAGDVVMVKSSLGLGFARVIKALLETFPAAENERSAAAPAAKGHGC